MSDYARAQYSRIFLQLLEIALFHYERFLDLSTHLYKKVSPSIGPSVRRLVGWSVGRSVGLSGVFSKSRKSRENGIESLEKDMDPSLSLTYMLTSDKSD